MIVLVIPFISRKAIACYPFILFKNSNYVTDKELMNHEKIHLKQQLEVLVLPFYLIYAVHFLYNLIMFKNYKKAYESICFEQEAYLNQSDLNYIAERKWWAFTEYF